MKAITITVDEELDARAAAEATRRGISKSELYRNGVTGLIAESATGEADLEGNARADDSDNLLVRLAGFGPPGVSVAPGEIDDVVYGT